jgi:hypothetical protein
LVPSWVPSEMSDLFNSTKLQSEPFLFFSARNVFSGEARQPGGKRLLRELEEVIQQSRRAREALGRKAPEVVSASRPKPAPSQQHCLTNCTESGSTNQPPSVPSPRHTSTMHGTSVIFWHSMVSFQSFHRKMSREVRPVV